MTDRAQFEAMLEALINDDQAQAKEIFHNIVVGKSREIYEELLAEDFSQDTGNPYKESEEDEMPAMEASEEDDAEEDDAEEDDVDTDAEEDDVDAEDDGEENPFGDEEGDETGDEDLEDRVMDLEDALEDLKAEFEQLLADEEGEEHMGSDDMGDELGGDMGDMGADVEVDELASLMEYVDKVAPAKMGDNGANTRSAVAGKNDMGGTTANIAKSFSTEKGGTQGGLAAPSTKPQDGGNVNVPGAKKATTLKPVKGGGIDRQAGFDNPTGRSAGAGTGAVNHDGEKNTQSTLRGRK
jgi:hypothetical protein